MSRGQQVGVVLRKLRIHEFQRFEKCGRVFRAEQQKFRLAFGPVPTAFLVRFSRADFLVFPFRLRAGQEAAETEAGFGADGRRRMFAGSSLVEYAIFLMPNTETGEYNDRKSVKRGSA